MAMGTVLTVIAVVGALLAAFVYFVGIPAEWKRAVEEKYIENMGESKAKDMMKGKLLCMTSRDGPCANQTQINSARCQRRTRSRLMQSRLGWAA